MKKRHFVKRSKKATIISNPIKSDKFIVVTPILTESYDKESSAVDFLERLGYKEI